jgi:hypothetical protein
LLLLLLGSSANCPLVATVKSRVYYALRTLRLVMAERGLCRLATVRRHREEPCR